MANAAEPVILAWDRNPEPDVIGYRVYFGTTTGVYPGFMDVGNEIEAELAGLAGGKPYFAVVTAYNTAGLESEFSEEIAFETASDPAAVPAATLVFLEAESGTATLPMKREADPSASGGMLINSGMVVEAGQLSLTFTAPAGPAWQIWARVQVPEGGEASLAVSLDGALSVISGLDAGDEAWSGKWIWARLRDEDGNPEAFAFTGSPQTLVLRPQQSLKGLDRLILSADPLFMPAGEIPPSGDYVTLTRQPGDVTFFAGTGALLEVSAAATVPVTYQWYRDGAPLKSGTDAKLPLEALKPGDSGSYQVTITAGTESTESGSATVSALVAPKLELIPVGITGTGHGPDSLVLRVLNRGNQALLLESSNNLSDWQPVESFAADTPGTDLVVEPGILQTNPQRFYRLRVPPAQ